jgi:hypothetical protein
MDLRIGGSVRRTGGIRYRPFQRPSHETTDNTAAVTGAFGRGRSADARTRAGGGVNLIDRVIGRATAPGRSGRLSWHGQRPILPIRGAKMTISPSAIAESP